MTDRKKRDELIVALAAEGYTRPQIAVRAGCSVSTVRLALVPGARETQREAAVHWDSRNQQRRMAQQRAYKTEVAAHYRPAATNRYESWTTSEVRIATDPSMTARQAAIALRRTPDAVYAMRSKMKKGPVTLR